MAKKISKFVYWTPRILSIMFILFLALFSLDIFDMKLNFWGTVVGLFMHNIPSLILLAVLLISWKYEIVGGIVFILAGLAYIILTLVRVPWYMAISWSMTIAGPAFLIGILFLVNWYKKRK
jgi:predicted neutral ceramidase superfamily lipid hydrolase